MDPVKAASVSCFAICLNIIKTLIPLLRNANNEVFQVAQQILPGSPMRDQQRPPKEG